MMRDYTTKLFADDTPECKNIIGTGSANRQRRGRRSDYNPLSRPALSLVDIYPLAALGRFVERQHRAHVIAGFVQADKIRMAKEDRVVKENDHAMDDIRYFCYTILAPLIRWADWRRK